MLFESCVGGVAVAMTFSSIFHFKFWFRRGVVLAAFLGAFWRPLWVLRASLGLLGGSFGGPWGDFLGSLEVLLAAVGCLRGPLGIPGGSWDVLGRLGGDFRDFPGQFREAFWLHFGMIFGVFSLIFWTLFFGRFLKRFYIDFGIILGAFLECFFGTFPTSRKMMHPTNIL